MVGTGGCNLGPAARPGDFPSINTRTGGQIPTVPSAPVSLRTAFCRTATDEPYRQGHERGLNPLDGEEDYWNARQYTRHYREKTKMLTADEIKRIRRFYNEFDAYLQVIREIR